MGSNLESLPLLLCLVMAACSPPQSLEDPVRVEGGLISGARAGDESPVRVYKGIPFAAPPVGELRWKPPQPVTPWLNVRPALEYGPSCMQPQIPPNTYFWGRFPAHTTQSEDCLYLNIWTPAKSPDQRLPVMVWIHGGGFMFGSGSSPQLDGTALARRGVVVVKFNYRLGVFGFLAHPRLSAESPHGLSGNYGMLDQLAALNWVRQNIGAFGGDTERISIFGVSAGSYSVSCLMAAPPAKGLFHRAIGESGGFFAPMRRLRETKSGLTAAEQVGRLFASELVGEEAADELAALRGAPAQKVITQVIAAMQQRGIGSVWEEYRPNVDGWLFTEEVHTTFLQGRQQRLPVIIGWTRDEGSTIVHSSAPDSREQYLETVKEQYGEFADEVFSVYPAESDELAQKAHFNSYRDREFAWTMRFWARTMNRADSKVWRYHFTRAPSFSNGESFGAFHGADRWYVFQTLDTLPGLLPDAVDSKLSDIMGSYWVNFASTGNPNGQGLPEWPTWSSNKDLALELGDEVTPKKSSDSQGSDLWERYYDARRSGS